MAMFCVKCGAPLSAGPFCVKCGGDTSLTFPKERLLVCRKGKSSANDYVIRFSAFNCATVHREEK